MFKKLITCAFALAASGAMAAPIVTPASSYSVLIGGNFSGLYSLDNTFDGNDEAFGLASQNVTVSETQTDEGGGLHRITLRVSGTSDLVPLPGEDAYAGVGIYGDGLDFLSSVYLVDARLRFLAGNDTVYSSINLADAFRTEYFSGNWNGRFADAGAPFSLPGAGGLDVTVYELEFLVRDTGGTTLPEPGSLALLLAALPAALLARRQRRASRD